MGIEDIKKNVNGENNNQNINNNNNDEALKKEEEARKKAEQERDDALFENSFNQFSGTYPLAKDFKDVIKEKVKNGYSVEDATIAVLQKEGKLMTQEQIQANANKGDDLGGSSHTHNLDNRGTDREPTVEEAAEAFRKAEANGEISIG